MNIVFRICLPALLLVGSSVEAFAQDTMGSEMDMAANPAMPSALGELYRDWREVERPRLREGAPDYSPAGNAERRDGLQRMRARLAEIETSGWPVSAQADYQLLWAEMNGLAFDLEVLRPWQRDPAFYVSVWTYQSDTPAHEGPIHHAPLELWTYDFPLEPAAERRLIVELDGIPPLLQQARGNLTGNARDLWLSGTRSMHKQQEALASLRNRVASPAALEALQRAETATRELVTWLESEAASKTGPSGVGRDNYTWYLRNVHLVPLSWEEELAILERELGRAHASLRLEEHRNRNLPPLSTAQSAEEYETRSLASVERYVDFIEANDILPVKDYMRPSLDRRIGTFVAPDEQNFFQLAMDREMMTLLTHFYHWWDLEMMREDPHPSLVRREPLLYNIWDSRAEGMATSMEEMMLHAGLYDDNPRVREIVWIMLAQRAARGIASLYAHANIFDMDQASAYQVRWTPNAWMSPKPDLLASEQQLYMRQPGYGSSYVSGKHQIEALLGEYADMRGREFKLSDFFGHLNASGLVPVSLIRWEMLGRDDEIRAIHESFEPLPED